MTIGYTHRDGFIRYTNGSNVVLDVDDSKKWVTVTITNGETETFTLGMEEAKNLYALLYKALHYSV